MSCKVIKSAYENLIEEDIEAIRTQMPDSLERWHIERVLTDSIKMYHQPIEFWLVMDNGDIKPGILNVYKSGDVDVSIMKLPNSPTADRLVHGPETPC